MYSGTTSKILPQYVAALSAAAGAFALGTTLGWSSPVQSQVVGGKYGFPVSEYQFSWIGSAVTLGAAFVCIPIGFLINLIGRKLTMLLLVFPFTLAWCLLIWAQNVETMFVARFILGISGGAFCITAPMYTGEIAEKEIRGILSTFFQLMITAGVLFMYTIGAFINVYWASIICALLPIVFTVILLFMPETPTYLVSKNNTEGAIKSIQWLRGKDFDYHAEIEELRATEARIKENRVSIGAALNLPITRKALVISLGLMAIQQLSGINAVIFYSTDIFWYAKTGMDANLSTIVIGIMLFVATFISNIVVDKLGRRVLLLASSVIMTASTTCLGIYFFMQERDAESVTTLNLLPLCSLCLFISLFSLGFGPIPWVVMGEVFSSDIKGVAGSIAGTTNWLLAFTVTKTFVNLKSAFGTGQTFWIFSAITALGTMFVLFFVPETKRKSLYEIQDMLRG